MCDVFFDVAMAKAGGDAARKTAKWKLFQNLKLNWLKKFSCMAGCVRGWCRWFEILCYDRENIVIKFGYAVQERDKILMKNYERQLKAKTKSDSDRLKYQIRPKACKATKFHKPSTKKCTKISSTHMHDKLFLVEIWTNSS